MRDRTRLVLAVVLAITVPLTAAVIVSPSVVPADERFRVALLIFLPGLVAVAAAAFAALRHDDRLGERLRRVAQIGRAHV